MNTLDELLEALPSVDLRLVNLGQHTGAAAWGAQIGPAARGGADIWAGMGSTPVEALTLALRAAGCAIE